MFRSIGILCVFSLCCLAGNHRLREETSQASCEPKKMTPAVYKGYVYWIGRDADDRVVNVYGPEGNLDLVFVHEGEVRNIAFDTDGTVAVSWVDRNKNTRGIDFRDVHGQVTKTIDTGRYLAFQLVFAEDHSLWTFGIQVDSRSYHEHEQDYMTVRKHSRNGQQSGAYLPRSLFPGEIPPASSGWQQHAILMSKDRVGIWLVPRVDGPPKTEWVELDLNGKLLNRKRLDEFDGSMSIALTSDARVYIQCRYPKESKLYVLDRDSSTWRLIDDSPPGYLIGADENTLEFEDARSPVHLSWYEPPTPTEKAAAVLLK